MKLLTKGGSAVALVLALLFASACSTLAKEGPPAAGFESTHLSCVRPSGFEQPGALAAIALKNSTKESIGFWQQTSESLPIVHFAWVQVDVLSDDGRWKERTVSLDSIESPSKKIVVAPGSTATIYAYIQRAVIEQLSAGERVRLVIFDPKRKQSIRVELISAKFDQCDAKSEP